MPSASVVAEAERAMSLRRAAQASPTADKRNSPAGLDKVPSHKDDRQSVPRNGIESQLFAGRIQPRGAALTLRRTLTSLPLLLAVASLAGPASAQESGGGIVDEVRVGALAHDVTLGGSHVESGVDINAEILFRSPSFLSFAFSPRPHLGGSVNSDGNTDQVYLGLTWEATLFRGMFRQGDRLFVDLSLGGAYQDGYLNGAPPDRKRLGSSILFRESVEIGYGLTPAVSVSAFVDHISNANLAGHNAGITNVGGRIGYKF
jgi:lipid A 3-O-deacylase